jgi:hypothetical protein
MVKILKWLVITGLFCFIFLGTALASPSAVPDSFMGIPWGASPNEVKQAMDKNGFTFWNEHTDDTQASYYVTFADGLYAGYSVTGLTFGFMSQKLYYVQVKLTDKRVNINSTYDDLKKLLTEKYGSPQPEKVLHIPVNILPQRDYTMDEYLFEWPLGNEVDPDFTIVLNKNPSWGIINVNYIHRSLRERLKALSRQNI